MTARALLVRGLIAGLLAGIATFLVAHQVGEPPVETAISLEESSAHHSEATAGAHSHDSEEAVVSRETQRTWGLLTGTRAGAPVAGARGPRVAARGGGGGGPPPPPAATAVVALTGFTTVALVPFLKYPANPPGIGTAETIGARTEQYFGFLLVSLVAGILALVLAGRVWPRFGTWGAVVMGVAAYVVVMSVAATLMPTPDAVGSFPADTLWAFRRGSLLTLVTLWAGIGVVLSGLVGRLEKHEAAKAQRRALAASL